MHMTEKEWLAFTTAKNLDPGTGRKLTGDVDDKPMSKWDLDEFLGKHEPTVPAQKPKDSTGFLLALIFIVSIGTYLYWVL